MGASSMCQRLFPDVIEINQCSMSVERTVISTTLYNKETGTEELWNLAQVTQRWELNPGYVVSELTPLATEQGCLPGIMGLCLQRSYSNFIFILFPLFPLEKERFSKRVNKEETLKEGGWSLQLELWVQ